MSAKTLNMRRGIWSRIYGDEYDDLFTVISAKIWRLKNIVGDALIKKIKI